jgi:uncharacterized protein (TIGR03435 family)
MAPAAFCQTAAPTFDVASIRESQGPVGEGKMHGPRETIQVSPDTVTMRNASLRSCIRWAYHVMDYQVSGPDVIARQRFDIVAKSAAPVSEDQLRLMMQTMLADRFKLSFHRQTREQSGYVLIVGKGGPKFKESSTEGESNIEPDIQRQQITIQRTPVSLLTEQLSNLFRTTIIDETGLKGKYDITINVAKYMAEFGGHGGGPGERGGAPGERAGGGEAPPDPISIIMRGVQEELGLKLEARSKLPVDYLIVDHIEKAPTDN